MKNVLKVVLLVIIFISIVFIGYYYFRYKNENIVLPRTEFLARKYIELEDLNKNGVGLNLTNFIENKYYLVMDTGVVYNRDELDKFVSNVNSNVSDYIRIVQNFGNGQPIIKDIQFTGNSYIIKTDNRWNESFLKEDRKIIVNEYDAQKYKLVIDSTKNKFDDYKIYYRINLIANDNSDIIYLCNYFESLKNVETNFKLEFNKDLSRKREIILAKTENTKYDYNVYSYNGNVSIIINNEKLTLREALLTDKITINEILEKADKDADEYKIIYRGVLSDGGSKKYFYDDYAILKYYTISGNRDVYIGNPAMNVSEINNFYYTTRDNMKLLNSF